MPPKITVGMTDSSETVSTTPSSGAFLNLHRNCNCYHQWQFRLQYCRTDSMQNHRCMSCFLPPIHLCSLCSNRHRILLEGILRVFVPVLVSPYPPRAFEVVHLLHSRGSRKRTSRNHKLVFHCRSHCLPRGWSQGKQTRHCRTHHQRKNWWVFDKIAQMSSWDQYCKIRHQLHHQAPYRLQNLCNCCLQLYHFRLCKLHCHHRLCWHHHSRRLRIHRFDWHNCYPRVPSVSIIC